MAKVLGIDQSTLSRIEQGYVGPAHKVYEALQRMMNLTLEELVVQSREALAQPVAEAELVASSSIPRDLQQLLFRKTTCEHDLMDLDQELAALELRLLTATDEHTLYECERKWLEARVKGMEHSESLGKVAEPTQGVKVFYSIAYKKYKKELLQLRANKSVVSDAELFRMEYRLEELLVKRDWLEEKIAGLAQEIEAVYQQAIGAERGSADAGSDVAEAFTAQISVVSGADGASDAEPAQGMQDDDAASGSDEEDGGLREVG